MRGLCQVHLAGTLTIGVWGSFWAGPVHPLKPSQSSQTHSRALGLAAPRRNFSGHRSPAESEGQSLGSESA